jgi:CHAD domain-containing protein
MRKLPVTLFSETLEGVLFHVPGVRDGAPESVHQARVGTRRLRELLPLALDGAAPAAATGELIRSMGRSLGAVRELDSLIQLTADLARRYPSSAPLLAASRAGLEERRQRKVRRLVKRLEDLDVGTLRDAAPQASRFLLLRRNEGAWRPQLARRLEMRANRLERKVDRAGGVYFPNRVHKVRIALKKLRYLAEIAEQASVWHPPRLVRDAKRLQDALGVMHDIHVLLDYVDRVSGDEWRQPAVTFRSLAAADLAERHRDYLGHRDRLRAMAAACRHFARGEQAHQWRGPAGLAAALLVPAGVMWLGRRGDAAASTDNGRHPIAGALDGERGLVGGQLQRVPTASMSSETGAPASEFCSR